MKHTKSSKSKEKEFLLPTCNNKRKKENRVWKYTKPASWQSNKTLRSFRRPQKSKAKPNRTDQREKKCFKTILLRTFFYCACVCLCFVFCCCLLCTQKCTQYNDDYNCNTAQQRDPNWYGAENNLYVETKRDDDLNCRRKKNTTQHNTTTTKSSTNNNNATRKIKISLWIVIHRSYQVDLMFAYPWWVSYYCYWCEKLCFRVYSPRIS